MLISKMVLPRRTFLRGMGTTLALPLLDAMVPALTATANTAANPTTRLGFFYTSNGVTMDHFKPKLVGGDFEISPILQPLAAFKNQLVVIHGLANKQAEVDGGSGPHTRVHATWLSGARPKRTEGADIELGTTIDQHAAKKLGQETPLVSLEMALEPNYIVGNCDNGYSCVYQNTFSWRSPNMPLPMENNPRVVFERLFGDGGSAATRSSQLHKDRSILDSVTQEISTLQRSLGAGDRQTVNGYLDAIRDVERRIQKAEQRGGSDLSVSVEKPLGIPEADDDHARLMIDLQFLAYQADMTRVVSLQFSREQSQRSYPYVGVPNGHHEVSHHQSNPERMALNSKINTFHVSMVGRLAEKMQATPDGDGTLLEHSMLVWGAGMSDGDFHSPHDLPLVIVGSGGGRLKTNRVVQAVFDTPMMNFGLALLDKVGVELPQLGDSTGRLPEI